jgi:hypothetical protein
MFRHGTKVERISDSRYFYVMGEGWYVLTREGESGPYLKKSDAIDFVEAVMTGSKSIVYDTVLNLDSSEF